MSLPTEDVLAIQKLAADYNHAIDFRDADGFADCFVEDGSLDAGMGVTEGREALRGFAAGVPDMIPGIRHLVTNVSVDGDGDDATTRLYLQVWSTAGGAEAAKMVISGVYHDTLRRTDDGWRYVTRVMTPDA